MAPTPRNRQNPSAVLLAVGIAAVLAAAAVAVPSVRFAEEGPEDCAGPGCPEGAPPPPAPPPSSLSSDAMCPAAGYLCARLDEAPAFRILRWPSDQGPLRVHVAWPGHEDEVRARALLRAAVRGIQAWQGRPFDLAISDRDGQARGDADVQVTWATQLDGVALGTTRARWADGAGEGSYVSVEVVLATRNPFNGQVHLTPEDVTLVAAHEMGHALGLPHSDDPRDLMYPTNTATRLTARDYRTMEALYRLPTGTEIASRP